MSELRRPSGLIRSVCFTAQVETQWGSERGQDPPKVMKQPASILSCVLASLLSLWDFCSFMIQAGSTLLACYSSAPALRRCSGFLTGTGAKGENMPQITNPQPPAFPKPPFCTPTPPPSLLDVNGITALLVTWTLNTKYSNPLE